MARRFRFCSSLTNPSNDNLDHDAASGLTRLRLVVEYDGTDFAGFQWQNGLRSVQGELEKAAAKLGGGQTIRVHGAGRTDAGVHATGQVVHFDANWTVPTERAAIALNGVLPRDIAVRKAEAVKPDFHSRYDATARVYRYTILNRATPSALLNRYALYLREPLDVEAMRSAARHLTGTHDFATFGQPDTPGKSTLREVTEISVTPYRDCLFVTVRGNAFLRQMVRCLVGTLVRVGQGKFSASDVPAIRDARDRAACPHVAAARGLCLARVSYQGVRAHAPRRSVQQEDTTE